MLPSCPLSKLTEMCVPLRAGDDFVFLPQTWYSNDSQTMRMSIKEQALTSPYLQFDRNQWAALRDSVPMTLTEEEIARLKGINEDLSLEEVAEIYLPL